MQQTRIEQGTPYFLRISDRFPDIHHLAAADEEDVLRLWQGLGYYSRARNLHATAKNIVENHGGRIPDSYDALRKLKGVGDYTAAAVASIAFDEPVPVVDGNVMRVVARLFAVAAPIDSTEGKKIIRERLASIFSAEQPGLFNEAIMEFGALQCTPANPNCPSCPLKELCEAFKTGDVQQFPVKSATKEVKIRHLNYLFLLSDDGQTLMRQRNGDDIWKNLYEFPLVETEENISDKELANVDFWRSPLPFLENYPIKFRKTTRKSHKLTHRHLKISFTPATLERLPDNLMNGSGFIPISLQETSEKPKPIVIAKFLEEFF